MSVKISQTLKIRFKRAIKRVQNLSSRPKNELFPKLYALYNQANEGDCKGRASGCLRGREKWKAWISICGTSEFDAITKYCEVD